VPRAHMGSALSPAGNTQAWLIATLGHRRGFRQWIDACRGNYKESSCCITTSRHSVGETGRRAGRAAARRTRPRLRWRASHRSCRRTRIPYTRACIGDQGIERLLPRWATVCGKSLRPDGSEASRRTTHAGHRQGSDPSKISAMPCSPTSLATRDHLGDMDFKVAGTEAGDLATDGPSDRRHHEEIMRVALARRGSG